MAACCSTGRWRDQPQALAVGASPRARTNGGACAGARSCGGHAGLDADIRQPLTHDHDGDGSQFGASRLAGTGRTRSGRPQPSPPPWHASATCCRRRRPRPRRLPSLATPPRRAASARPADRSWPSRRTTSHTSAHCACSRAASRPGASCSTSSWPRRCRPGSATRSRWFRSRVPRHGGSPSAGSRWSPLRMSCSSHSTRCLGRRPPSRRLRSS